MKTTFRKGTLSDAINAVSTMDIIEAFDVPNRTKQGRTEILCPGHDDRHFGSCYVDKDDDGYYCYACKEHVNKWNMVLLLNGNNKADACEWFFKTSGITPNKEYREDPFKKATLLVKKLSNHVRNDKIFNDIMVCEKQESSYGRNLKGDYMYSELVSGNPLLDLYKGNKELFKKIVISALKNKVNRMSATAKRLQSDKDGYTFIDGAGLIPNEELCGAFKDVICELNELILETEAV